MWPVGLLCSRNAEEEGISLVSCSRSAHAKSIRASNYGRCSLDGRSWTNVDALPNGMNEQAWREH